MGKKLQKMQPGRRCFSSRGLFSVFHLWQTCANQKPISGLENPKGKLNWLTNHDDRHGVSGDKTDDKILRVDATKRTVKELMDEESSTDQSKFRAVGFSKKKVKSDEWRSNLSTENIEAEAFINEALKKYLYKDRRNHCSQRFLDAITVLKTNQELFLKLIKDPDSLLAKHIQNLQDLHAEKERSKLVSEPKHSESVVNTITKNSEEVLGTKTFQKQNMYSLVWDKIKIRYDYPSKLRKNPRALRSVEVSESVSWCCSSLHSHSSKNKTKVVEPSYFSFKTKSKSTKGDANSGFKPEIAIIDDNVRKSFSPLSVRYFDIVEEEAKRHLSERLMNVSRAKCFSEEESPRILGKILHLPQSRIFDSELDKLRNRLLDADALGPIFSMTHVISSADQMENAEANNLSQQKDFDIMEFPSSPSSIDGTIAEQRIGAVSSSEKVEHCSGFSGQDYQDSPLEYQQLLSLQDDSSSTPISFRDLEIKDQARDRAELPSSVSVLEHCFYEDFNSPPSITTQPDKPPIEPLHIDFEELSPMYSSSNLKIDIESSTSELDLISTYMKPLLQNTCSSWDELFLSWQSPYSSNQFFDPSLIDEMKLPFIDLCDQKLFFDTVNEAASEVYQSYFRFSPFVSSIQSKPDSIKTCVVVEIKRRVDRYFHPQALPGTVEKLAGEDHVRSQTWMDIREDVEEIIVQVVESILEQLVTEMRF